MISTYHVQGIRRENKQKHIRLLHKNKARSQLATDSINIFSIKNRNKTEKQTT